MLSILRLEQLQFRKLGIAKLCTQLHPAHFSLYPILCNTLKVIRTKISNVIGKFSKIYPEKFKVVHFDWKLEHMVSWRCLFQIWTFLNLDFEIPTPKSIFGDIWEEKVEVVRFAWKLAHMVSQGCWFLFRHWFYETPNLNPFLGKFEL